MYYSLNLLPIIIVASLHLLTCGAAHRHGIKNGDIPEESLLPFTIGVPCPNQAELDQFVSDLYDPTKEIYHQFVTPQQFYSRFSPKDYHIEKLKKFLEESNFEIVSISENKFLIEAFGKVKHINRVFNCTMGHYTHKVHGYSFRSPDQPIMFPSDIILAIIGLDNSTTYSHSAKNKRRSLSNFPLTPSDIANIYGIPTSLQGSSQSIALVEYDNFIDSDISTYASMFSLPTPNFNRILINPTCGICCSGNTCTSCSCTLTPPTTPGTGQGEVTLDIQMAIAVAPKAQILVYIAKNTLTVSAINQIAQDNLAKTVSTSWGFPEDEIFPNLQGFATLENNIFKQMASQGQSFFAATGDHGAFGDFSNNPTKLVIQDPSSQPFVTAVGGTQVNLDSSGNRVSETTWFDAQSTQGSGGGISVFWPLPSYQNSLGTAANKGSTTFRMVPDVSLNADPNTGYLVILNGNQDQFGGTSASAPLWAAFTCLINEYRATQGLASIGFLNPTIYPVFQGNQYSSLMNDINDNSNNGFFPAVTGYDLATGWGTFKAQELLLALSTSPTSTPTTSNPTKLPTANPTNPPTANPTNPPTDKPSNLPTDKPINLPTDKPTNHPSNKPTIKLTSKPSSKPTLRPTTTMKGLLPTSNPVNFANTPSPTTLSTTKTSSPITSSSLNITKATFSPTNSQNNGTHGSSSDLSKFPTLEIIIGSSVGGVVLLSAAFLATRRRGSKDKRPMTLYSENPLFRPQQEQTLSYPNY